MSEARVTEFPDPQRILATLQRARPATVASIVSGQDRGTVKLTGVAEPGPAGPLTAPMSGQPCVWYRSLMTPESPLPAGTGIRSRPTPYAPSDVPSAGYGRMIGAAPVERLATTPFSVTQGAAAVVVDPAGADVDSLIFTVNERRPRSSGQPAALWQEWIVPVGAPVFVLGGVYRDQRGFVLAAAAETSVLLVSTNREEDVVARQQVGARRARRVWPVALTIGGVVLLVIVCVLIVIALVV